jgi:hypothetical protein
VCGQRLKAGEIIDVKLHDMIVEMDYYKGKRFQSWQFPDGEFNTEIVCSKCKEKGLI